EEEAASRILTPDVAAAKVHDWIGDQRHRVLLSQLAIGEADKLAEQGHGPEFPLEVPRLTDDDVRHRIQRYEELSQVAISIIAAGCYYGEEQHEELWIDMLQRAANWPHGFGTKRVVLDQLQRYPALLLLYAGGIASVASKNYGTLLA